MLVLGSEGAGWTVVWLGLGLALHVYPGETVASWTWARGGARLIEIGLA